MDIYNKQSAMKLADKKAKASGGVFHVIIEGYSTLTNRWLPVYDVVSDSYAMNEECNIIETYNYA
tara:strand:+ start:475 stop:669 length:195 start_codon:yes stop_codon:yes gene_type:complete